MTGRNATLAYWSLVMRWAMGVHLLTVGWRLLTEGGWKAWPVIGGILPRTVRGPFAGPFLALWESPVILALVIAGCLGVGAALLLGAFVRLAALGGALMMALFYVAVLPPPSGWVTQHVIYFLIFVYFFAVRPEPAFGLDGLLRRWETRIPALRWVVG